MAFLTLEDMKGFVEVILFPEVFKAALPCLRGGDPLLVRGILDLSEEHVKIKAIEVHSLPELTLSPNKPLHLKNTHFLISSLSTHRFKRHYRGKPRILQSPSSLFGWKQPGDRCRPVRSIHGRPFPRF